MPLAAAPPGGAPTEYERLQGFALWPPRARTAQHRVLMGAALLVLAIVAVAVADQYGATDDTPDHRLFGPRMAGPIRSETMRSLGAASTDGGAGCRRRVARSAVAAPGPSHRGPRRRAAHRRPAAAGWPSSPSSLDLAKAGRSPWGRRRIQPGRGEAEAAFVSRLAGMGRGAGQADTSGMGAGWRSAVAHAWRPLRRAGFGVRYPPRRGTSAWRSSASPDGFGVQNPHPHPFPRAGGGRAALPGDVR